MDPEVVPATPLSVVIPTIRGWPAARLALDALREQAPAVGAELIVLDASDRPVPTADEIGHPVTWLKRPGGSVFDMRLEGYGMSRGEIVATTEDHCIVAPDWCARTLAIHAAHPEAVAVGGAVVNGTDASTLHRAAFFRIQGPFMPPVATGPSDRLCGAANLSYKRHLVERFEPAATGIGVIDNLDLPPLEPGEVLLSDDGLRVSHLQATGFLETSALDFHNGRSTAGHRRTTMRRGDWVRLGAIGLLPFYRSLRTYRLLGRKEAPRSAVRRAMPLIVWLHACQAAGELVGYAFGPGSSPRRLY